MILTVTLNAALDVTYEVDALIPYSSHRIQQVYVRAGGKGINVARVLATLGEQVVVTGLCGGSNGAALCDDLKAAELNCSLVSIEGESRRTVTVVATVRGDATVFNEPGPLVTAAEWDHFVQRFDSLVSQAQVTVCAGSLPRGIPVDAYSTLIRIARRHGSLVLIDTDGPALLASLKAGPDLLKPNAAELRHATGIEVPLKAADSLRGRGAHAVVASLGADGLIASTPVGRWRAQLAQRLDGNPTGAGDACVAALAFGLAHKLPWPQLLREAVACSAAAVAAPVAGDIDASALKAFRPLVHLEELDATDSDR